MLNIIENAFAALNEKLIADDQAFAAHKRATKREAVEAARETFKVDQSRHCAPYGGFCITSATIAHYGSKGMWNLLDGRGEQDALDMMRKNTEALIAKRHAQIVNALTKKGITEIAPFELVTTSQGYEGTFVVDGHRVTINTILAGGYNIQRLHVRCLVKVN